MTGAALDEIRVPVERLLAAEPDDDAAVERFRAVVHGSPPSLTLLRVADSSIRRYDIWTRGDQVVTVPYRDDRSVVVPCGYGSGGLGAVLIGELLADSEPSTSADDPDPLRFDDVGGLVRAVAAASAGVARATVLHSQSDEVDLVRASGPGTWWGAARAGQPLELTDGGDAAYWGRVFSTVR